MKKLTTFCLVISFCLIASHALADETYTCTSGSQERVVSVVYQDQEEKVPCEVRYQKEGVTETLWSAESEAGFCEEKAREFVEKQRGWGWDCDSAAAQETGAQ